MNDTAAVMAAIRESFTEDQCPGMDLARIFGPGESTQQFRRIGLISIQNLLDLAGLQPQERVLDIGCGAGRVALPLTSYLDASRGARYVGIDPVKDAIKWCQRTITPRHPHFTFRYENWSNGMYNKRGRVDPNTYRFPFPDGSFDLVYMFSVFTHMRPAGVQQYLTEIGRLLPFGGRLLTTMFLVDDETEQRIAEGRTHRPFQSIRDATGAPYWTDNLRIPESAIAYHVDDVRLMMATAGLAFDGGFAHGGWRERKPGQDIVVVWKR